MILGWVSLESSLISLRQLNRSWFDRQLILIFFKAYVLPSSLRRALYTVEKEPSPTNCMSSNFCITLIFKLSILQIFILSFTDEPETAPLLTTSTLYLLLLRLDLEEWGNRLLSARGLTFLFFFAPGLEEKGVKVGERNFLLEIDIRILFDSLSIDLGRIYSIILSLLF